MVTGLLPTAERWLHTGSPQSNWSRICERLIRSIRQSSMFLGVPRGGYAQGGIRLRGIVVSLITPADWITDQLLFGIAGSASRFRT